MDTSMSAPVFSKTTKRESYHGAQKPCSTSQGYNVHVHTHMLVLGFGGGELFYFGNHVWTVAYFLSPTGVRFFIVPNWWEVFLLSPTGERFLMSAACTWVFKIVCPNLRRLDYQSNILSGTPPVVLFCNNLRSNSVRPTIYTPTLWDGPYTHLHSKMDHKRTNTVRQIISALARGWPSNPAHLIGK